MVLPPGSEVPPWTCSGWSCPGLSLAGGSSTEKFTMTFEGGKHSEISGPLLTRVYNSRLMLLYEKC